MEKHLPVSLFHWVLSIHVHCGFKRLEEARDVWPGAEKDHPATGGGSLSELCFSSGLSCPRSLTCCQTPGTRCLSGETVPLHVTTRLCVCGTQVFRFEAAPGSQSRFFWGDYQQLFHRKRENSVQRHRECSWSPPYLAGPLHALMLITEADVCHTDLFVLPLAPATELLEDSFYAVWALMLPAGLPTHGDVSRGFCSLMEDTTLLHASFPGPLAFSPQAQVCLLFASSSSWQNQA